MAVLVLVDRNRRSLVHITKHDDRWIISRLARKASNNSLLLLMATCDADGVAFDAVAQVFAHFAHVALGVGQITISRLLKDCQMLQSRAEWPLLSAVGHNVSWQRSSVGTQAAGSTSGSIERLPIRGQCAGVGTDRRRSNKRDNIPWPCL